MRTTKHSYLHLVLASAAMFWRWSQLPSFSGVSKYAGIYSSEAPDTVDATGPAGPAFSVSLGADGTATVTQDPGKGAITTFGHWADAGSQITVKFDEVEGKPTDPPMVFSTQPRWIAGGHLEPCPLGKNDSSCAEEGRVQLAHQQET
jgi:hypothetical protein